MSGKLKISLIGAGAIGGTLAHLLFMKQYTDIVLLDINASVAKGKALDISQSGSITGSDVVISGTDDYSHISNSDAVIITAGIPRKPGMSRDDLIGTNAKIIASVAQNVGKYAPNAFVIIITNPLDIMVQHFQSISKIPHARVVGMAGVLDTARFVTFLSEALSVSKKDIKTLVLGGHGDTMVPLLNYTTIGGVPISQFVEKGLITQEKLDEIVQRTRNGGAEIVALLGNGSAFYSPAHSAIEMVESYLFDKKQILPCASYLQGEYGVDGLYIGVPIVIGKNGVEKIIEASLSGTEKIMFANSVEAVKILMKILENVQ
jgi:malate dehydrogenase